MAAALLLGVLVLPWRPPTLCLLRAVTGLPCPLCGGTTALVQLGRGELGAALRASPLVVLGAPVWLLWPRLGARLAQARDPQRAGRAALVAGALALLGSELWQLHRLGG